MKRWTLILLAAVLLVPAALAQEAPKNVIVMISDGCGFAHVEAADRWRYGDPSLSPLEAFPGSLAMSTHSLGCEPYDPTAAWESFVWVAAGATDSAAAGTALASGQKTYNGAIGVVPTEVDADGRPTAVAPVPSVLELAEILGKATGVVSSVQFSHATPASFVAHNEARGNYEEIGREMILESPVDVIMGCGHPWYNEQGDKVDEADYAYVGGEETWEIATKGLPAADADGDGEGDPWVFVDDRAGFANLLHGDAPARVLGIPMVRGTLNQQRLGDAGAAPFDVPLNETVPTLAEMTAAALNVLDADPDGLFLMVEGGAVDWASHANQLGRMIEEQVDFVDSVDAVVAWVETNSSWEETLVIVTADHETGYLAPAGSGDQDGRVVWAEVPETGAGELPNMEWHSLGHTNSLVPLYAGGVGSERLLERADSEDPVRGPYVDNTDIPGLIFELWDSAG
jgi:alkaline phosphatase